MILYDRNAEEAVLGSMLIDPEVYFHLAAFLKPDDFFLNRNQWIWETIASLANNKIDIDLITVTGDLERRGVDFGGSSYIMELIGKTPTSSNAISYGHIVEGWAKRRGLMDMANKVVAAATSDKTLDEIMNIAQAETTKAVEKSSSKRVTAWEAASMAIDAITNHPRYFAFGISNLDDKLSGIFPDRLYIWAGYQGTGKTAFAIQNCRLNSDRGHRVLFISLEMSPIQVWLRMACGDLGIDVDSVLTRKVDENAIIDVTNRAGVLGDRYQDKMIIYPAPMSLMDILAAAKRERPDIIWIDHSNLLAGKPKEMDKLEWAGFIPRFLRQQIAKMGISVHLLQQLNRSANKDNRRPTMHDLRLAGEDDPDVVTLLYRPDEPQTVGMAKVEFITDKNRFGWTGTEDILFDLPHQKFISSTSQNFQFRRDK